MAVVEFLQALEDGERGLLQVHGEAAFLPALDLRVDEGLGELEVGELVGLGAGERFAEAGGDMGAVERPVFPRQGVDRAHGHTSRFSAAMAP